MSDVLKTVLSSITLRNTKTQLAVLVTFRQIFLCNKEYVVAPCTIAYRPPCIHIAADLMKLLSCFCWSVVIP